MVIVAGGTGGHFFPAEALASEFLTRGREVALMTDARSGGLTSDVFARGERIVLSGAGIAGRGWYRATAAAAGLARGTWQARTALRARDVAAIVGFGGYPCVAPVLASRLLRRRPPVILHEQNAVLGRANRALARFADVLALSFDATARVPADARSVVVGNPVRPTMRRTPYAPPAGRVEVLVLGGSLGARVMSDVVPAALAALADRADMRVTQQCRAEDIARVRAAYAACGVAAELAPFFPDVPERLARAHLVIARAGASTVAELAAVGRPAILVPLPHAIDDHQTANARALADAGGAWLIAQPQFTPETLAARLVDLLGDPATLAAAAANAARQGRANAAADLADLVERTLARETP
ncbi:MAG: undecaprenyldiphospho-muramoylpentapeptide beta-N-acetylglucosaminyltransferase [Acidisphaera sp.]|nr:undecaprenyldiphospho-muramoylpentapeptide beta-N-acetylglucosaminyltransferase [Acidisphaera sp.]